ncbi:MAG: hypothetical protein GHHEDOFH_00851 [Pseudorhodoplanes sp.]|nr:hypothetical protein [Pseudorhodoplanes sp.]
MKLSGPAAALLLIASIGSSIACPSPGPFSSRPEWVQDQKGCKLFIPMPPVTMPSVQRAVSWDGDCVSGFAEGSGKVSYLWNNFAVLTAELSPQTGAIMKAGRPAATLAPNVVSATGTCERYVGGGWSERRIEGTAPTELDLSNPLLAVAIAAQLQQRAAQRCPPPKEQHIYAEVQLRRNGILEVCARSPAEYLLDIDNNSYASTSARIQNEPAANRWSRGVRQYASNRLSAGTGTQQELCNNFSKHRAAVLGLVAQLKNERNPLRSQQLEAQINEANRAASQELVRLYGDGLKKFESYVVTVDKLEDRGFGRIGMSASLGCPGAPLAFDVLFSNEKIADPPNPNDLGLLSSLPQFRSVLSQLNQGDRVKLDGILRRFVIGAGYDFASISLTSNPIVLRIRVTQLAKL